jgi:hypothetical protein
MCLQATTASDGVMSRPAKPVRGELLSGPATILDECTGRGSDQCWTGGPREFAPVAIR